MIKQYVGDLKLANKTIKAKHINCDSLLELTSYARVHDFANNCYAASCTWRPDFYGKSTFSDCLNFNIISSRDQKKLEKLLAEKVSEFETVMPDIRYDVAGNELDVGRVMGGEPECFFEDFEEVKQPKKALLKVNMAIPWQVKKSDITYRAITIMAIYEWLRTHDISAEVELFNFGEFCDQDSFEGTKPKDYDGTYVGVGPMSDPPKKLLFNSLTGEFYRRVFHSFTDYFSAASHATLWCEPWKASEEERKAYDLVLVFNGRFTKWGLDYDYKRVCSGEELDSVIYFG